MRYHEIAESADPRASTLEILMRRAPEFELWLADLYGDDDSDLALVKRDQEALADMFVDFLSESDIRVRDDGLIEFHTLSPQTARLIGNLPVALYHYTSTALLQSIRRNGLHNRGERTNPYQNSGAGVYLTTEGGGPAVTGYIRRAVSAHGGDGIRVTVKMFLHELHPDPDDADIESGKTQFVASDISANRIVDVESI